ncbi:phosphomevalonate kinase [Nocardia camponoti]|uniref:phosphomevalonate kinase n=1 Tax=Nocardia camponoti TaxID=1616106 RepID=A0A917QEV1_9NOCA|nr:phosphomevalonate kinase [Nocardia camponoti]GGK47242.1 hypothetical protein GCM10011591_18180 [Nocardia camponoti]
MSVSCRAPGKLFLVGEYAVVEPGHAAVLIAVDRFATASVSASATTVLRSDLDGGIALELARVAPSARPTHAHAASPAELATNSAGASSASTRPTHAHAASPAELATGSAASSAAARVAELASGVGITGDRGWLVPASGVVPAAFSYVFAAVTVVDRLVAERGLPARDFTLDVRAELGDADGRKFGLGSSAAVTVATVDALAEFYDLALSREDVYRLAMAATIAVNPSASGGDIAAATFGGWLAYRSPDRAQVAGLLTRGVEAALRAPWPGLLIRPLPTPTTFDVRIGWTGAPASTPDLVRAQRKAPRPTTFLADSDALVERFIAAVEADDYALASREMRSARALLTQLDQSANLGIMTDGLRALCDEAHALGLAAKSSGAGGGDCGVALSDSADHIAELHARWRAVGIEPLPVAVYAPAEFATEEVCAS